MKKRIYSAGISGRRYSKDYPPSHRWKKTIEFLPFRMEIGSYMFSLRFLCFWVHLQWADDYKEIKDGTEEK